MSLSWGYLHGFFNFQGFLGVGCDFLEEKDGDEEDSHGEFEENGGEFDHGDEEDAFVEDTAEKYHGGGFDFW